MVMLISSSICMTSVEVRGVQLRGGGGASGFARNRSLLFIGFQSLSAGGRYYIEPILFTSL
jgi:hypothetical protein